MFDLNTIHALAAVLDGIAVSLEKKPTPPRSEQRFSIKIRRDDWFPDDERPSEIQRPPEGVATAISAIESMLNGCSQMYWSDEAERKLKDAVEWMRECVAIDATRMIG